MQALRRLFGGPVEEEEKRVDVLEHALDQVQRKPEDAKAHFNLGSIYYVRGRIEEAVSELEQAIELAPTHGDANYMLGLAYEKLGRFDDARRVFRTAGQTTHNPMLENYVQQKLANLEGRRGQP
jgi:Flp pilus assembly protein TadD